MQLQIYETSVEYVWTLAVCGNLYLSNKCANFSGWSEFYIKLIIFFSFVFITRLNHVLDCGSCTSMLVLPALLFMCSEPQTTSVMWIQAKANIGVDSLDGSIELSQGWDRTSTANRYDMEVRSPWKLGKVEAVWVKEDVGPNASYTFLLYQAAIPLLTDCH